MSDYRGGLEPVKQNISAFKNALLDLLSKLSPSNIKREVNSLKKKPVTEIIFTLMKLNYKIVSFSAFSVFFVIK